ncbi:MAG TPA: SRPBCC family protein [Drouetiella sp.]
MPVKSKSNELKLTRVYNAPLKAVWEAWTDPDKAAKWWGPRGHHITTDSKDVRTGGHWKYTMYGPNGEEWPTVTKYLEVIEHQKLVYDHGGNDERPPLFRVTVLFSEENGKTRMDMTMALESPERAEEIAKHIKNVGGNSTWDRLDEYLEKDLHGEEKFCINRSFNCSQEKMFELWTSADHIAKWMSPTGTTMEFIRSDIRAGGTSFYCMTVPDVMKMYGRIQYLEINKPNQIVYLQNFCDANENVTRHPMSPTWPETMKTVIDFASEGPDQCRVTINWTTHGTVTPEEMTTFTEGRPGMTVGWTGSLDKLESYVESH